MQISQNILDKGLLAELAYLKLENFNGNYSNYDDVKNFINDNNEDITGVSSERKDAILNILKEYTIDDFITTESGMQGMVLVKNDGSEITVAYRGTETGDWFNAIMGDNETSKDISSDIDMALGEEIQQMKDALAFMEKVQSDYGNIAPITITGHSLGGALAQYVAYKSETKYETYTFNGFGIRKGEGIIGTEGDTSYIHNFHLGIDFVSGIGSIIGGQPGGEYLENAPVFRFLPKSWVSNILNLLNTTNNLATTAQINAKIDEYMGSFLGEVVNITPYDISSISDYRTDHFMSEVNDSLKLYLDLSQIFKTTDIESINYDIAQLSAVPFDNFSNSIYEILKDSNGLPKALELIGYSLLGKTLNDGTRYNTFFSTQNILIEIKNLAIENNGLTVFFDENHTAQMLYESAKSSKAILYTVINGLPPVILNNENASLYSNINLNSFSDIYLQDLTKMYYYMINNTSFLELEANYINNDTGIKLQTLRDIPTVIFGSNDETKNETIYTQKTNDRIYAGKGDDTIIAWGGNNLYDGGEGNDTVSYKTIQSKEGITLNLSLTTAQTINSTTTDTLVNIENVIGSKYADNITAKDNTTTTLNGGFGNDTLEGGNNSENILLGEDGDDYIYGGITTDEIMLNANKLVMNYLDGGNGKDYLIAGKNANNYLFGGAGNDTLVSTLIGFKNESAGIDFSYGSSYLNGGEGIDTYVVKDYVTIEDEDGLGEIQTKYGKLQDLTIKTLSDGTILLLKNNPMYLDIETIYAPLAGYGSGAFNNILGNVGTTTQGMSLTNYELIFKLQKDGNDLILNDLTFNPTVIRIKNYTANSLNLNITQDMLDNLPSLDENINPTPTNPTLIGTNESETLIGSEINNTFISNAGDDILKDISGGNDIYKFKKGDGADTIYDIKGNDTIIFDETVLKEDITFSQSEDLKSLIINYSPTDSITITNYFDSFSKIENIQLSNGEKLIPEFNTQTIGKNQAENIVTGYGNDTVTSNQGDDTIKDLSGNDIYIFKVGDGNDTIEDLDGIDKIVFENLSNDDLIFTQKDNNLIINYSTSDSVTILNYFDNTTSNYLEKIAFKNDLETIDASNIITGTVNDDEINGTYFDDVITSNKGNDTLKGSYGNDTYKFSKGDGNNRIYDVKGDDTITFDETINKEDISFSIKDNNLLITYSATDTIEVLNYFDNTNKIENIKLSTGEIVEVTNIDKTLNGTEQNDTLIGSYGDDILIGNDGDDTLNGNVGKDKLFGGRGFDTYVANDGDIINDSDNLGKIIFEGQTCWDAKNLASARIHTWPPDA